MMQTKYPIVNNARYVNAGEPFESMVWFVQWRKPQQRSLKRTLRRNGFSKDRATKIAHTVYIESNREKNVFQVTRKMFSVSFRYCF